MIDPENPESIEDMEFLAYREIMNQLTEDIDLLTTLQNFDHFPELEDPGDFKADNEAKEEKEGIEDL